MRHCRLYRTEKSRPADHDGLRRLEYRGYDSAGVAVVSEDGKLELRRASGKLPNLEEAIRLSPIDGVYGVGHTRWATHGRPTEENAHPHRDCKGEIVVVHNGIVENYIDLKHELEEEGHRFVTETDTEIVAHLVEKYMDGGPLEAAVRKTIKRLSGVYALAILSTKDPEQDRRRAQRALRSSIGLGQDEYFVASDIPGILSHTRDMFFLGDGDIAVLTPNGVQVTDLKGAPVQPKIQHVAWDPITAEKGGFKHFMQKEIFEQPRAVRDTMLGRISLDSGKVFLDDMDITEDEFREFRNIKILACGTSWHAGPRRQIHDRTARAGSRRSGLRQRIPLPRSHSRSPQPGHLHQPVRRNRGYPGRAARGQAKRRQDAGHLQRRRLHDHARSQRHHPTHAGPEIGVASTKAFTAQLTALLLISLYLGQIRNRLPQDAVALMQQLTRIPHKMETVLQGDETGIYEYLARQFFRHTDFLYLGARHSLSHRPRRRAQAQGNFLHPRRRLSRRRNEARPQRPD